MVWYIHSKLYLRLAERCVCRIICIPMFESCLCFDLLYVVCILAVRRPEFGGQELGNSHDFGMCFEVKDEP